jgi:hypothetical protein
MSETDPLKVQNDPTLHRAGQTLFSEIRQRRNHPALLASRQMHPNRSAARSTR